MDRREFFDDPNSVEINKDKLVKDIAFENNLPVEEVEEILSTFEDCIRERIKAGEEAYVPFVGRFELKKKYARKSNTRPKGS